jgi:hypothetical protein
MPRDFYPRREADIVSFTASFSAKVSASPEQFGLTPLQAEQYAAVQAQFADLQQKSTQGSTNTSSVFQAKKNARRELERMTRQLAGIARTHQGVTVAQRFALGLPARDPGRPRGSRTKDGRLQLQRIGPPRLIVKCLHGRTMRVRLRDRSAPMNRGKPKDVAGATLFSYVGELPPPPDDLGKWKFERVTTKTVVDVRPGNPYAGLPPGTRVWIIAFWTGRRGERGPMCEPVYAHTQYGVEIGSLPLMRKAA